MKKEKTDFFKHDKILIRIEIELLAGALRHNKLFQKVGGSKTDFHKAIEIGIEEERIYKDHEGLFHLTVTDRITELVGAQDGMEQFYEQEKKRAKDFKKLLLMIRKMEPGQQRKCLPLLLLVAKNTLGNSLQIQKMILLAEQNPLLARTSVYEEWRKNIMQLNFEVFRILKEYDEEVAIHVNNALLEEFRNELKEFRKKIYPHLSDKIKILDPKLSMNF